METVKSNSDLKVFIDSQDIIQTLRPLFKAMLCELIAELVQPEVYLTRKDVAKLLAISLPTVDKLTKDGVLTVRKIPGTTLIRYFQSEIPYAFQQSNFKLDSKRWIG